MKFENQDGKPVEINFQNFQEILPGGDRSNFVRVKFKDGTVVAVKATAQEIADAVNESARNKK